MGPRPPRAQPKARAVLVDGAWSAQMTKESVHGDRRAHHRRASLDQQHAGRFLVAATSSGAARRKARPRGLRCAVERRVLRAAEEELALAAQPRAAHAAEFDHLAVAADDRGPARDAVPGP